jgi:LacI family transcriptional regulator
MNRKPKKIGLAVDAVGAYGRGIVRGVMAFCRTHPHWVITEEPQWSFSRRPEIKSWNVDGIIAQIFSLDFEKEILATKIPATNVSLFCDAHRLPTVLPDDVAIGVLAAEYLLNLGLKNLAYVWPADNQYGQIRLDAFRKRAADVGLTVHECNVQNHSIAEWLPQLPRPVGVLGCNDDWAHRVLKTARLLDIRVPDEMAVLGVDDDELMNTLTTPSLSSIATPVEQIGYEAAALLERMMDGESVPAEQHLLPPVRVVPRRSTEMMFIEDPDVTAAMQFIVEHAAQPIHIEHVLKHVPLSRRSLERRFREVLGRSVSEQIRRVHVERAKQLLITTDLAVKQIAAASGFESSTRMGIIFQQEVGETPTGFRQRSRMGNRNKVTAPHMPPS